MTNVTVPWVAFAYSSAGAGAIRSGNFDQIRVSNLCRYPGEFTPATSAFTTDSYTKLLLHMDGTNGGTTFTDSSGSPGPATAFTTTGTWTCPTGVSEIEYIIVGGGGSGGGNHGGAGGGGEFKTGTASVSAGTTYTMTVGDGGTAPSGDVKGVNGGVSSIAGTGLSTITSVGGGGGGTASAPGSPNRPGSDGGSGKNLIKLIDDSEATADSSVKASQRVFNIVSGSIQTGTSVKNTAASDEGPNE